MSARVVSTNGDNLSSEYEEDISDCEPKVVFKQTARLIAA